MPVLPRIAIAALVLGPLALAGLGVANLTAFNSRASALEGSWSVAEAAGVTPAQMAPARASLQALRDRRVAFLPYAVFSGALLADPFGQPESVAARGQSEALAAARQRAQDDLAHLQEVGGPNFPGHESHASSLAAAHQLADYAKLARAWEAEATQLGQLASAAGGLTDGLPKDVVDGVARLQGVMSAATEAQVATDPAAAALAHAQAYLKQQQYPQLVEQHDAIAGEVRSAGDTMQHRVDVRIQANQLVGRLPELLGQAGKYGVSSDLQTRATQAKADVLGAESSGDDARMEATTGALKQAVDRLNGAVTSAQKAAQAAALAAGSGCIEGAAAQLIVIHTATQKLVAYDKGCPFLTTLVTTGRPAVRTDVGTFTIHRKEASHLMHSPWPPGDPLWYPDTVVHDAMLFVPADGSYIHSAEWEPASAYGPGSQNGAYASHGCVHVQNGPLGTLYNWAQVGATVIVTD
jgi:lipoprotein-anchoring transpeptidase ErfK/SrfK